MDSNFPVVNSYLQLKKEWMASSRGQGGVNAIKGFDFQLLSAILKIAESDLQPHCVVTEELSDISEFHKGGIVVTQSKYCISSAAVYKALDELWELFCILNSSFPELKELVTFSILGATQDLKNPRASISSWEAKKHTTESPTALSYFTSKISTQTASHPLEPLVQILISKYGVITPYKKINEWLGKLYNSISSSNPGSACEAIRCELLEFRAIKEVEYHKCNFYLWKETDLPPESIQIEPDPKKAILVGQLPKKIHLVEGRFVERNAYQEIYDDFMVWVDKNHNNSRGKIPVFWISGRSGSGKSVALLHLLARLKLMRKESIVAWFGNRISTMDGFFPYIDGLVCENPQVYLAFDDPYSYENQLCFNNQIEKLSVVIERLGDSNSVNSTPVIICCGPDEQLEWCKDRLGDDLDIYSQRLVDESKDDITELKEWYQKRTGAIVKDSEYHSNNDKLLVQTLFQWVANESLEDFAKRFKKRLNDKRWECSTISPFELVSIILSANRLYARFPWGGFNDFCKRDQYLERAMYTIESEDHHIAIDDEGQGIRLTHPHLSEILYREWYSSPRDLPLRRKHIEQWLEISERHGNSPSEAYAPLWVIARLSNLNSQSPANSRLKLISKELTELLKVHYHRQINSNEPLSFFPVWVNLDHNLQLNLIPSPLECIANNLRDCKIDASGYRLSCHKLIEFYELLNEDARENLLQIIQHNQEWYEWHEIAYDYIRNINLHDIYNEVIKFVSTNPHHPTTKKIVHYCLLNSPTSNADSKSLIECWLNIIDINDLSWVGFFTDYADIYPISDDLWKKSILFLIESNDHRSWSFVWERLWKISTGNKQLIELGIKWTRYSLHKDRGWSFIWIALIEYLSDDNELIELGFKYLNSSQEASKPRKLVFEKLKGIRPNDPRIELNSKDWLKKTRVTHDEWIYIWTPVVISYDQDQTILELGRKWLLEANCLHPSWIDTRSRVLKSLPNDDELTTQTIKWLSLTCPEHESWQYCWESSWKYDPQNAILLKLGLGWLVAAPVDHGGWNRVWESIWDNLSEEDAELYSLGISWLKSVNKNHRGWKFVWVRLFKAYSTNSKLVEIGLNWLRSVSIHHYSWAEVWGELFGCDSNNTELVLLGEKWLKETKSKHSVRRAVESKLHSSRSMASKLSKLQDKWGAKRK